jgi:hypothetical protein
MKTDNILPSELSIDHYDNKYEVVVYDSPKSDTCVTVCEVPNEEHIDTVKAMVDRYNAFEKFEEENREIKHLVFTAQKHIISYALTKDENEIAKAMESLSEIMK